MVFLAFAATSAETKAQRLKGRAVGEQRAQLAIASARDRTADQFLHSLFMPH